MARDPYEILQVSRRAEPEVIQAAYRRLARKYHPDVDSSSRANARMQDLNWAYEILSDPITRARYDRRSEDSRESATTTSAAEPERPAPSRPEQSTREEPVASARSDEEVDFEAELQPRPVVSVLIASLLVGAQYVFALLSDASYVSLGSRLGWTLVALGVGMNLLLAVAASAGWNPRKITVWRVLVMFALSAVSGLTLIPSYLAGKAVARKMPTKPIRNPSKLPVVAYGIGGLLVTAYLFGALTFVPDGSQDDFQFSEYRDSEIEVSFQHPDFFAPESEVTKHRTEQGDIVTISMIAADSADPSAFLGVRLIEDPVRNQMFPGLYPPDDDAMRALVMTDIGDLQFSEAEVSSDRLMAAAQEAEVTEIAGWPAATYSVRASDTPIGDAVVRGALVVTDKRDVSIRFVASVEPDVEGSLSGSTVDEIWNRITTSLVLNQ